MKQVAGTLRLDLASYAEKQAFAQFGSDLDASTQYQLSHGARMTELLKQSRYSALDVADQIIALFAGKEGFLDDLDINQICPFRDGLAGYMQERHEALRREVRTSKISDNTAERLKGHIASFKKQFLLQHPRKADLEAEAAATASADDQGKA